MAKNKKLNKKYTTWLYGYLFIAPTIIGVLILNLWPVAQSLYYSFNEVKGFKAPIFIGLDNYSRMLNDPEVYRSLYNTFLYCILTVPLGVFFSLVVAALLNAKIKGKSFFRSIYFLPVVSAPVAVALVWKWLYNQQYGLINQIFNAIGLPSFDWLGSSALALPSIAVVGIWSMVGYNMIILIAGLQNIPTSLYEAADIDGATPITKFIKITIPMVSPTLFFVTVITVISSFQVFDHIFMMLKPESPSFKSTQSVVYLFYRYTFENYNMGYGSAIVILVLIVILILTIFQLMLQKKWVHYDN